MPKHHFKANVITSGATHLNVDRKNGSIKNVVIVQQGINKNGTFFNTRFLTDLVTQGNAQPQGVKCRFGHPNMCATSLGSYLGRYKNFRKKGNKVLADLTLDPITQKTQVEGKGISMWEYVLDMAAGNPDMFGNSIVVMSEEVQEKVGGKTYGSHKLQSFLASDLVDDPAATEMLFSQSNDLGITVTRFLDEHPEVFSAIAGNPDILDDFFSRYATYLQQYKQMYHMNFLEKMRKQFGKQYRFDIEETTATGELVTVVTEDESPKEGDPVIDENGKPVPDGDLTLKDGTVWVIEEGLIAEIKTAEDDSEPLADEDATLKEVAQSVNTLARQLKGFRKQYQKGLHENQEALQLVATSLEKRFSNLAKTVKSGTTEYYGDPARGKKGKLGLGYDPDKVREAREARS